MSHIILDNALVAIHKSKVTLMLNTPANVGISKVLIYEFH